MTHGNVKVIAGGSEYSDMTIPVLVHHTDDGRVKVWIKGGTENNASVMLTPERAEALADAATAAVREHDARSISDDLRETVAREIHKEFFSAPWEITPLKKSQYAAADAAIAAARPIIEQEVIKRLVTELTDDAVEFNGVPLGWSAWAGRLDVEKWIRSHLTEGEP